ncbi:kelch repeat-containing protein [Dyadobacter sp. BHUBP1]|uniref:kelch repeat-containing protein n=1 Tax=Dyadobacter sp. BHUBP1 TaxID=3424178 RepID=UPI003D33D6D9
MSKTVYFLLFILLPVAHLKAQLNWQEMKHSQPTESEAQSLLRRILNDPDYYLGSNAFPSPRTGANSWQDNSGNIFVSSGLGYDRHGSWGLLDDLWKYNPANDTWQLLHGEGKALSEFVENTSTPSPRRNALTWIDREQSLWLMGGKQFSDTEYLYDLWKYNTRNNTWVRISDATKTNVSSVWSKNARNPEPGNIPGSRAASATWVDKDGRFWLFGGISRNYAKPSEDLYNDLWMYEPSTMTWTWVAGNNIANYKGIFPSKENPQPPGPSARSYSAAWYEKEGHKLWLYAGIGIDSTGKDVGALADLWSYDITSSTWHFVSGSTKLYARSEGDEDYLSYPGYRSHSITWKDKNGKFYLYGGQNKVTNNIVDTKTHIWQFDPALAKWHVLLTDNVPTTIAEGSAYSDDAGHIVLFGGRKLNRNTSQTYPTNQLWKINLK